MDEEVCCASVVPRDEMLEELCQIVVNNFKKLEEEKPTDEQQMDAWGEHLKDTDSGHRPC